MIIHISDTDDLKSNLEMHCNISWWGSTKTAGAVSGSCGTCTVTFRRSAVSACEGNRCCMHRGVSTNSDSDDCGGDGGRDGATRIYAMILGGGCSSEPPNDRGLITPGICDLPAVMSRSVEVVMVCDLRGIWKGCSNLASDASDASDVSDRGLEATGKDHDVNDVAVCDSDAEEGHDGGVVAMLSSNLYLPVENRGG